MHRTTGWCYAASGVIDGTNKSVVAAERGGRIERSCSARWSHAARNVVDGTNNAVVAAE